MIYARDIGVSRAFYECLGLVLLEERHGDGPLHFAAELPGSVFEIYPRGGNGGDSAAGGVRLGFRVHSVDAAIDEIRAREGRIVAKPKDSPRGRCAVVEDPDGYRVELTEAR